jgi:hypothetical protein
LNLSEKNHCILQISVLLLGISLCSYHVRELVVCLLFFSLLFISLALVTFGGILAFHAGKYALPWTSTAGRVTPAEALGSADLHLKIIADGARMK